MQPAPSMEVMGPWNEMALRKLEEWDPAWAEACKKMSTNPWENGVLNRKLIELICVGLNATCAKMDAEGTRRHIRAMAIDPCAAGFRAVCKEASAPEMDQLSDANRERLKKAGGVTRSVDDLRELGLWKSEWDILLILDPIWTDEFVLTGLSIYTSGVLSRKDISLLSVALDSSFTHMDSTVTERHINNAVRAGATIYEIMDVLKLCVSHGVATCNLAVPILAEEMTKQGK